MCFDLRLRHRIGDCAIDVRLTSAGRMVALHGPSGAGKSSILNMVAGLTRPDEGRIVVDGRCLFDSDVGVDIPPAARGCGYIFQDVRLFPHLTVRGNLRYGARRPGPTTPTGADFDELVELLGLRGLLHRWPAFLSGGEARRVAIARALLSHPTFLLMDEALVSLDEARRDLILALIGRWHAATGIPILYVSHDRRELDQLDCEVVEISPPPAC